MKRKILIITIGGFIVILYLLIDIFLRLRYCIDNILIFDSQEFNNITAPIISFLGFIAVVITIVLTAKQINGNKSENFFDFYQNAINSIDYKSNSSGRYKESELLDFVDIIEDFYDRLKKDSNYIKDLESYKTNHQDITTEEKSYYSTLSQLMIFKIDALLFYYDKIRLIKEIESHTSLIKNHKDLLLDKLISEALIDYVSACDFIKESRLELIDNLFHSFDNSILRPNQKSLKFFDESFFKLFDYIMDNKDLKSYYDRFNAH